MSEEVAGVDVLQEKAEDTAVKEGSPQGVADSEHGDKKEKADIVSAQTQEDNAEKGEKKEKIAEVIEPGRTVEVFGLIEGKIFNGSMGIIEEYVEAKQRWKVKFDSGTVKNFKADNLRVIKVKKKKKKDKDKQRMDKTIGDAEDLKDKTEGGVDAAAVPASSNTTKGPTITGQRNAHVAASLTDTLRLLNMGDATKEAAPEAETVSAMPEDKALAEAASEAAPAHEEELAAEQIDDDKGAPTEPTVQLNVAGRMFTSRSMLIDHVRALQTRLDEGGSTELAGEDMFLFFHLALRNPKALNKLKAPVKGFRYGLPKNFSNKCFMLVFSDGTEEPLSWMKSIKELFTGSGALKTTNTEALASSKKRPLTESSGPAAKKTRVD